MKVFIKEGVMNRGMIMLIFAAALAGCSVGQEKAELYLDNPEYIIKDHDFSDYKDKLDKLESSYLAKEMTYAEYLEKKEDLDKMYDKSVKDRNQKISNDFINQ